jgi:signal transduction histidine kinase
VSSPHIKSRQTPKTPHRNHDPDLASLFVARQSELIDVYRQRLLAERSPFGLDSQRWHDSGRYAREILSECAFSLRYGRLPAGGVSILDEQPEYASADERDHAAIQCIHAARILFQVTTKTLCQLFQGRTDSWRLAQVLTDLHTAVHRSLEKPAVQLESVRQNQRDMSRQIHDHIGNSASLALRQLELFDVMRRRGEDEQQQEERLENLKNTLVETVISTRELVTGLRVDTDTSRGLKASLVAFLVAANVTHPVVHFDIHDDVDCLTVTMGDSLFVMLRECLRNTINHAHASTVTVGVGVEDGQLVARVKDDGVGFDPRERMGNGLRSLYERAELFGGTVTVMSGPDRGTLVTLNLPLAGGDRDAARL